MKSGEWVLLDEMNLASQSVLEGLNACLDHRGEVFVPELGQTFIRHPDFRLFAAQNPHHQGGGRKGLPASFVNRFTVVYADAFKSEDLLLICRRRFPSLDEQVIAKAVQFVEQLENEVTNRKRVGANGGPWEFNLRDVSRWLALTSSDQGLLQAGTARDFVEYLFSQRFRTSVDRGVVSEIFERVFEGANPRADLFPSVSTQAFQLGLGLLPRNADAIPSHQPAALVEQQSRHPRILESLMLCVQQSWPVILTGSSGVGKSTLIERLATAVGAPLVTIAVNAETDAMDLVGGYEQFDPHRQTFRIIEDLEQRLLADVRQALKSNANALPADILALLRYCDPTASPKQLRVKPLIAALKIFPSKDLQETAERLQTTPAAVDKARFEWIDGLLVDALQEGKWLVLDNANLCSPSVLDRLNSLLEPDGSLIINEHSTEDGDARVMRPHPNFRIFLTLDPRYGELSRAMRNRAVELHLSTAYGSAEKTGLDPLFTESAVARLRSFKAAASSGEVPTQELARVLQDHLAACDQPLLVRFKRQLDNGLYDGSQLSPMPSLELQAELVQHAQGFNEVTISQLQGPADFASVQVSRPASTVSTAVANGKLSLQTLHPLNNQPLICTTPPHTLSHASSFAVFFDLRVSIASMQQLFRGLQSDATLVKQLRRLEQSLTNHSKPAGSKQKDSQFITVLGQVLACFARFAQSSPHLADVAMQTCRLVLGQLCTIWIAMHQVMTSGHADLATLTSFLTIASKSMRWHSQSYTPALSIYMPQLSGIFDQLLSSSNDTRGLVCTALWSVLRPWTPSTLEQLKELLDFETLVDRFDTLYRTSKMTLDDAAVLRNRLAQALRVARFGGRDLNDLTEKLRVLGLGANDLDDTTSTRSPHFLPIFERLHGRFASVGDDALVMPKPDLAKLEIFAQYPTTQSRLSLVPIHGHFIPSRSPNSSFDVSSAPSREKSITYRIATADQVPLAEFGDLHR